MQKKVVIDIQSKERIYINPYDGTRIPRITPGITGPITPDVGEAGELEEGTGGAGETGETQTQ